MKHNLTYFVSAPDGTLLIDGIGYCFPARGQKKPEPRTYIRVTEVTAIEKAGKKYGFYEWVPAEKTQPSEEDLIAAYLRNRHPGYLMSEIQKLHLPGGEAIVLRCFSEDRHGRYIIRGISLNGWAENAVSVSSFDRSFAETWGDPESYFPEKKTMLDLLLEHGYGDVTDDDIFEALKKVCNPSNALYETVPWGHLAKGKYHGKTLVCVRTGSSYVRCLKPILKGLPVMDVNDFNKMDDAEYAGDVSRFVSAYVKTKCGLDASSVLCEPAPIDISPAAAEDLILANKKARAESKFPDLICRCLRKNILSANYLYPDYLVFNVPELEDMPIQSCYMLTALSESELLEVIKFVNEQHKRTAPVVQAREKVLSEFVPLNFAYIRGENACAREHSELLDEALDKELIGSEASWNGIEYIKTTTMNTTGLIADYTEDELHAIVAEINRINREAEARIRSAIAHGKLPVSAVASRKF